MASSSLKPVSPAQSESVNEEEEEKGEDCLGLCLEKLSVGPSKKLLVLNLSGLLYRRFYIANKHSIPKSRGPDAIFRNQLVFKRPFCDGFLEFCLERFDVGIWSSAMEKNVKGAMDCALGDLKRKVLFTWDQSRCTNSGTNTLEKKTKPLFLKELKKIWDSKDSSLPWHSGKYSSSNTLLIDDSPDKALLNPPNTGIFPHPYNVDEDDDDILGSNGELRLYLEGLADHAGDVPSYVKAHSIGQPAITTAHPDWNYYSKVFLVLA